MLGSPVLFSLKGNSGISGMPKTLLDAEGIAEVGPAGCWGGKLLKVSRMLPSW